MDPYEVKIPVPVMVPVELEVKEEPGRKEIALLTTTSPLVHITGPTTVKLPEIDDPDSGENTPLWTWAVSWIVPPNHENVAISIVEDEEETVPMPNTAKEMREVVVSSNVHVVSLSEMEEDELDPW
jgi:hypothetical protein